MSDATKLPPLPERECSLDSGQLDLFTVQQMREYGAECRRMALEAAARFIERTYGINAAAIRALKGKA